MLDKTEKMNQLLDRYEELLTEKQRDVMSLYYRDDLSLREIAQELSISHNAVFDLIKRTEKLLTTMEEKLGQNEYYYLVQAMIRDLKSLNLPQVNAIIEAFENNLGGKENE